MLKFSYKTVSHQWYNLSLETYNRKFRNDIFQVVLSKYSIFFISALQYFDVIISLISLLSIFFRLRLRSYHSEKKRNQKQILGHLPFLMLNHRLQKTVFKKRQQPHNKQTGSWKVFYSQFNDHVKNYTV